MRQDPKKLLLAGVMGAGLMLGSVAPAVASQCPADMAAIDEALQTAELSEAEKAEVMELRQKGEELHESGQHGESVETLAKAKEMLGIE